MALSILDGNQTATTLSTVLSAGAHIPAHTVVSLGAQAITDMRSAVSGSVVSISNLPATQTIAGTVTANFGGNSRMIGTIAPLGSATTGYVAIGGDGTPFSSGAGRLAVDIIDQGGTSFLDSCLVNSNAIRAFGTVTLGAGTSQIGSVTASVTNSVTVGSLPRPTWTDYSGTIVTAGTAVTAISTTTRSYLLAQVTTGQMFINIGATATTLNSVYFSAGQGFAWETSVPQGIVSIISSVTGTNYVLKDG